ncbi:aa3-type cytochrome c oxidase subunit IV [Paracoccaceae bacterium]|nr:aa3-type cytochrome c oxidase subunit IV [Paracoccaceae bacterium]
MDYEKGGMDIEEQKKVYSGFIKFLLAIVAFSTFALVFLAVFNS